MSPKTKPAIYALNPVLLQLAWVHDEYVTQEVYTQRGDQKFGDGTLRADHCAPLGQISDRGFQRRNAFDGCTTCSGQCAAIELGKAQTADERVGGEQRPDDDG